MTLVERLEKAVSNIRENAFKSDNGEDILNSPCTSLTVSLLLEEAANELKRDAGRLSPQESWLRERD
jgi:translation initiation factor 2B subunit (eIF-2B alpha/beta/delta family)